MSAFVDTSKCPHCGEYKPNYLFTYERGQGVICQSCLEEITGTTQEERARRMFERGSVREG